MFLASLSPFLKDVGVGETCRKGLDLVSQSQVGHRAAGLSGLGAKNPKAQQDREGTGEKRTPCTH